jgi:hypothetical protein
MDEFRRPSSSAVQGHSRRTLISARMRVLAVNNLDPAQLPTHFSVAG